MLELSYYGDDFTGSTDVMEALSSNGVPTALFTRIPTDRQRAAFSEARAIGLAGESRSRSPAWMDSNLPAVFEWLRLLGARHCHYKTCATFDSAAQIGSIGRATEIGMDVFDQRYVNIVVGAPQLRRYTLFGTLFASFRDGVHRIDRHPVMSRHPATPMAEADLTRHLAEQTSLQIGCVGPDATRAQPAIDVLRAQRKAGERISLLDVYDANSQGRAGALIEEALEETGPFIVGSSGVEYALIQSWREAGRLGAAATSLPLGETDVIAVVSGSCSPTTERQIKTALEANFTGIQVDYAALAYGQGSEAALAEAFDQAAGAIRAGSSPILYTALGAAEAVHSTTATASNDRVGRALGTLLSKLTEAFALDRVCVAGGDTSTHALSVLDVYALTLRKPLPDSPGSPVCFAHRENEPPFEIALKGGQVGSDRYFVDLRDGI